MHGRACVFWADLTPCALQGRGRQNKRIFSASRSALKTGALKTTYRPFSLQGFIKLARGYKDETHATGGCAHIGCCG
jgi:hypothetical protein